MFWGGIVAGLLALFWGEKLVVLLFGEVYRESYKALILNIWAGIFVAQGIARGIWLIAEDLQKYRLFNNIFAVALNVVLNIFVFLPAENTP